MRKYHAKIQADRYPWDVTVEASSWSTAASRAVRAWQKRFKRSRADTITIKLTRGVEIDA